MQKLLVVSLCSLVFLLTSCAEIRETPQDSVELDTLVEDYFEAYLNLNPLSATFIGDMRYNDRLANSLGRQYRADSERLNRDYLERLKAIDATKLNRQDRLTYETFKLNREQELEMLGFPGHLLAIPSQALAYKVGELKIRELRTRAEAELGERFDVRGFHAQVLMDGALSLSLLESKINQWMESKQA